MFVLLVLFVQAENGYDVWLRYKPVKDQTMLTSYRAFLKQVTLKGNSATIQIIKDELVKASNGMLSQTPSFSTHNSTYSRLFIGNVANFGTSASSLLTRVKNLGVPCGTSH